MHPLSPDNPSDSPSDSPSHHPSDTSSDDPDPLLTGESPARYREAFRVADELALHHSGCVCPRCAGRLTGLLSELARTIRLGSAN